jgi:hypothetical protein
MDRLNFTNYVVDDDNPCVREAIHSLIDTLRHTNEIFESAEKYREPRPVARMERRRKRHF